MAPYASYWETAVPYDFRAEREALLDEAADEVGASCEIVSRALVASREDGKRAAAEAAAAGAEAMLVVQTMAAMPAFAHAAIRALGRPVVVWALHRSERLAASFDHADITTEGATVGAPMLTSLLVREGRPFELVVRRLGDEASLPELVSALQAAAAATRLGRARIGRVGQTIDGYDHVTADPERLARELGATLVPIEPAELREAFLAVPAARVRELDADVRATYRVDPDAEGDSLDRSLRAACALDDLITRYRLDAGAINCHVPEIRFGDEIGVTPCFALGLATSRGVPWSCTGDVVTPIAMLATTLLGGAAQYHELESLDYETGELVVASSGEHDLAFGDPAGEATVIRNGWFARDSRCGVCACFGAPAGPATLVAFTQIDAPVPRFRFVVGEGEFTGRRFADVGTPWAAFRFHDSDAIGAWRRWCEAGASHHSSATPGALADGVASLARFLGVEVVRV